METPTILVSAALMERFGRHFRAAAPNADFLVFADQADMVANLHKAHGVCLVGDLRSEVNGRRVGDIAVADCPQLRWVQTASAGVDQFMPKELAARGIVLTNGSGAAAPAIAEHVLSMMFAFSRGLVGYMRTQAAHKWDHRPGAPAIEMSGKTLSIYGVGRIGTELAWRAHALGLKVYGVNLPTRPKPDFMEALWAPTRLDDLLAKADFFAACIGLTDGTKHLFAAREFGLMKSSAYFINIGRGGTVDQNAMIDALQSGKIAGAGLDVVTPEPLPDESPLWDMPNVIITPHVAGASDEGHHRADEIFLENIRRFAAGETLMNVVNIALV